MPVSDPVDSRAPQRGLVGWACRTGVATSISALVLLVLAVKFKLILAYAGPGSWNASWWREAVEQGRLFSGRENVLSALINLRGAIPLGVDAALLAINGQWDPVLQAVINAAVFAATLGLAAGAVRLFWPTQFVGI